MSVPESGDIPRDRRCWKLSVTIASILFLSTLAVFWQSVRNRFVEWDDQTYVYEQPRILSGISIDGLLWATTANVCANWHPLTVVSLQMDAQLFGPDPVGFHRTAILIHAINAALAFLALQAITGCRWKSVMVAALFAFHPTRVESVAWVSERKGLLCGVFFFLTLLAYARYVAAPTRGRYLLVTICLALGLCAKPMAVTTPVLLLLLDYWPLRRLSAEAADRWLSLRKLVLEKIPLFALSAISSFLTMAYQKDAILYVSEVPVSTRPENAVRGYASYVMQTFWPARLSHFYPIPDPSIGWFTAAAILLVAITGIVIWQRNRRPYLLVGWFWFLGMLVPMSGMIQVGYQQRADRYLYLAQIGLFLSVVWFLGEIAVKNRLAKVASIALFVVYLGGCIFMTVEQIPVWHDSKSLWHHAYLVDSKNRSAIFALTGFAFDEGNRDEALRLAEELADLEDNRSHEFLFRLCTMLVDRGEFNAAVGALDKAMRLQPDSKLPLADLLLLRGESFAATGRWAEAASDYRRMTQLAPDVIPLQFCLAHALAKAGNRDASVRISSAALSRLPRWPEFATVSAWKISTKSDSNPRERFKAVCLAEEANTVTGGRGSKNLDVLAAAYAANGQFDQAIAAADSAIRSAERANQSNYAETVRARLQLYKEHHPFVEGK